MSRRDQVVSVAAADLAIPFAVGETIWTESFYKYLPSGLVEMGRSA